MRCTPRGLWWPPPSAARAVRSLGLRSLGALRRSGHARGSNGFPKGTEFLRALSRPTDVGGWPNPVLGLLAAVRTVLAVLAAPDRRQGEGLWMKPEAACVVPAARVLIDMMRAWRQPMPAGLDHRHLDATCRAVDAVRRGLGSRRPALGFADLRRFALLGANEVRTEGEESHPVAKGVSLPWLARDLLTA